jgi:DNA mismatch endonuclease, patch repair protein
MARIRAHNTKPELIVRRLLHSLGYRYRLHGHSLPGRPDLVFTSRRKLIFIHGCFWHQHDDPSCRISRKPTSNTGYWQTKLERNAARDLKNEEALTGQGWSVMTVWECQLKRRDLPARLRRFLGAPKWEG